MTVTKSSDTFSVLTFSVPTGSIPTPSVSSKDGAVRGAALPGRNRAASKEYATEGVAARTTVDGGCLVVRRFGACVERTLATHGRTVRGDCRQEGRSLALSVRFAAGPTARAICDNILKPVLAQRPIPRCGVACERGGHEDGVRRTSPQAGISTDDGGYRRVVGLDILFSSEPKRVKNSSSLEHSFRYGRAKRSMWQKSHRKMRIGSETVLEKGQSATKCRSKTASAPEIARRLTQKFRKCRFFWAMVQKRSGQTIQALPYRRGVYYYTRQAGALA